VPIRNRLWTARRREAVLPDFRLRLRQRSNQFVYCYRTDAARADTQHGGRVWSNLTSRDEPLERYGNPDWGTV